MVVHLATKGHPVNRKRVQRPMGVLGLAGMAPCQWERKSVPVTGIGKCTTLWERISQSGESEIVESPPFWESCLANA